MGILVPFIELIGRAVGNGQRLPFLQGNLVFVAVFGRVVGCLLRNRYRERLGDRGAIVFRFDACKGDRLNSNLVSAPA